MGRKKLHRTRMFELLRLVQGLMMHDYLPDSSKIIAFFPRSIQILNPKYEPY